MITKENYESWFLDYVEKQLSPEQVAELFLFLESHPELKEEFDSFQLTVLTAEHEVSFDLKHTLHKPDYSEDEIRELMPAAAEGDLTKDELTVFEKAIVAFPRLAAEYTMLCSVNFRDADTVTAPDKAFYYQEELSHRTLDAWLIAEMEGDLSAARLRELNAFIASDEKAASVRALYQHTKLTPAAVEFPLKSALYRKEGKVITLFRQRTWWVAASILLLFVAWYSLRPPRHNAQVAVKDPAVSTPVIIPAETTATAETNVVIPSGVSGAGDDMPADGQKVNKGIDGTVSTDEVNNFTNSTPDNHRSDKHNNQPGTSKKVNSSSVHVSSPQLAVQHEKIETIPSKPAGLVREEEPFAYAERRLIRSLPAEMQRNELPSAERLLKLTGETTAALIDHATDGVITAPDPSGHKLPLGSRLIRVAAWALGKVSDDRIRIKTTFDPLNGSLAACEVETGNKKWQKEF